jgi:peptidoglycan/LPS O-acetylase OafA/YrhL
MSSAHFVPVLFAGLIAWRVYRRIRRNIGRQPLHPRRAVVSIVILSLISILILGVSWPKWPLLSGLGGGILAGAALGFLGLGRRNLKRRQPAIFTCRTRTSASPFPCCSSGASSIGCSF